MDYRRRLESGNSKEIWDAIVNDIGSDPEKFSQVMDLFLSDNYILVQRVSQAIGIIGEKQPQLIAPYLPRMLDILTAKTIDALKRNVLRIFQFIDIPKELEGKLFDIALTFLKSNEEAIAIRVFSMTALRKICEKHNELSQEIIHTIEIIISENKSGGIQSRGKKELSNLHKLLL
jgi:hypothetical protein